MPLVLRVMAVIAGWEYDFGGSTWFGACRDIYVVRLGGRSVWLEVGAGVAGSCG